MNVRIGTSPDSWGVWFASDPKQIPWHRYLDEVVITGYEWTELGPYGYLPTDLSQLRGELERRGLKVPAGFAIGLLDDPAQWTKLEHEVVGVCESVRALGGHFAILIDDLYTNPFTGERTAPVPDGAFPRPPRRSGDPNPHASPRWGRLALDPSGGRGIMPAMGDETAGARTEEALEATVDRLVTRLRRRDPLAERVVLKDGRRIPPVPVGESVQFADKLYPVV